MSSYYSGHRYLSILCCSLVTLCTISIVWNGAIVSGAISDELRLTLPNGYSQLIGGYMRSYEGRGIRAFTGIPYAEPPVGDLRFRAPVPAKPWHGERMATEDPNKCLQRDPYRRDDYVEGNEDCLYLNVYTPLEPRVSGPLPVMMWIHGGGFMCGSGIRSFYGPNHLLDQDIIFVSPNYRLGPLGFLSTGEQSCPGNNGLKDQALALQWIQDNIAAFGGDPNSVTIFGESAGGASSTYLMASPLTKGLFHKAILQSGSYHNPWAQPAHNGIAQRRAEVLGEKMGCTKRNDNWSKMIECLRSVDPVQITNSFFDFFEWDLDPMVPFPPVVEPNLPGAFLTEDPRKIVKPHGSTIPIIIGVTLDEGALKSPVIINDPEVNADFKKNLLNKALPISLYYHHHSKSVQKQITQQLVDFYFGGNDQLTSEHNQNITNIYSDSWFVAGVDEYVKSRLLQKDAATSSTYFYLFAHKGSGTFTDIFKGGIGNYYGVTHAEDLQYLFPAGSVLFPYSIPSVEDHQIRRAMVELWTNFARTGNPTPNGSTVPTWTATENYPLNFLRIGNKDYEGKPLIGMESGLMEERIEIWHKLKAHLPAAEYESLVKEEL